MRVLFKHITYRRTWCVKVVLFVLCFASALQGQGQSINYKQFLDSVDLQGDDAMIITLTFSKGKKSVRDYFYCHNNRQQKLTYFENDTLVNEFLISHPNLFEFVQKNSKELGAAVEHFRKDSRTGLQFSKDFRDTSKVVSQLSIRKYDFFYNHLRKTDAVFLSRLKRDNVKKGYEAINYLYHVMEQIVANGQLKKND